MDPKDPLFVPGDICNLLLSYLAPNECVALASTSVHWRQVVTEADLWQRKSHHLPTAVNCDPFLGCGLPLHILFSLERRCTSRESRASFYCGHFEELSFLLLRPSPFRRVYPPPVSQLRSSFSVSSALSTSARGWGGGVGPGGDVRRGEFDAAMFIGPPGGNQALVCTPHPFPRIISARMVHHLLRFLRRTGGGALPPPEEEEDEAEGGGETGRHRRGWHARLSRARKRNQVLLPISSIISTAATAAAADSTTFLSSSSTAASASSSSASSTETEVRNDEGEELAKEEGIKRPSSSSLPPQHHSNSDDDSSSATPQSGGGNRDPPITHPTSGLHLVHYFEVTIYPNLAVQQPAAKKGGFNGSSGGGVFSAAASASTTRSSAPPPPLPSSASNIMPQINKEGLLRLPEHQAALCEASRLTWQGGIVTGRSSRDASVPGSTASLLLPLASVPPPTSARIAMPCVAVGICTRRFPLRGRMPGWCLESYGYHGDDGNQFHDSPGGTPYGPKFGLGDTIGCGIAYTGSYPGAPTIASSPPSTSNSSSSSSSSASSASLEDPFKLQSAPSTPFIFFTKNGSYLGPSFHGIDVCQAWYPAIGLDAPYAIQPNWGRPGSPPLMFNLAEFSRQLWVHSSCAAGMMSREGRVGRQLVIPAPPSASTTLLLLQQAHTGGSVVGASSTDDGKWPGGLVENLEMASNPKGGSSFASSSTTAESRGGEDFFQGATATSASAPASIIPVDALIMPLPRKLSSSSSSSLVTLAPPPPPLQKTVSSTMSMGLLFSSLSAQRRARGETRTILQRDRGPSNAHAVAVHSETSSVRLLSDPTDSSALKGVDDVHRAARLQSVIEEKMRDTLLLRSCIAQWVKLLSFGQPRRLSEVGDRNTLAASGGMVGMRLIGNAFKGVGGGGDSRVEAINASPSMRGRFPSLSNSIDDSCHNGAAALSKGCDSTTDAVKPVDPSHQESHEKSFSHVTSTELGGSIVGSKYIATLALPSPVASSSSAFIPRTFSSEDGGGDESLLIEGKVIKLAPKPPPAKTSSPSSLLSHHQRLRTHPGPPSIGLFTAPPVAALSGGGGSSKRSPERRPGDVSVSFGRDPMHSLLDDDDADDEEEGDIEEVGVVKSGEGGRGRNISVMLTSLSPSPTDAALSLSPLPSEDARSSVSASLTKMSKDSENESLDPPLDAAGTVKKKAGGGSFPPSNFYDLEKEEEEGQGTSLLSPTGEGSTAARSSLSGPSAGLENDDEDDEDDRQADADSEDEETDEGEWGYPL